MSIHREMTRLKNDGAAARQLARMLLAQTDTNWTDWEADFLEAMTAREASEPLSTRQAEKLVELKDAARRYERIDGFSVVNLVRDCWMGRCDLTEDDEAFIAALKEHGDRSLKLRPLMRLIHCSRQLGLIDHYVAV